MSEERAGRFFYSVWMGILITSIQFAIWQHNVSAGLFLLTLLSTLYSVYREWRYDSFCRSLREVEARLKQGMMIVEKITEEEESKNGSITH